MSMGRAVIATRSPGLLDYVVDGETGILVDFGDVHAWREAIQYLLSILTKHIAWVRMAVSEWSRN